MHDKRFSRTNDALVVENNNLKQLKCKNLYVLYTKLKPAESIELFESKEALFDDPANLSNISKKVNLPNIDRKID